MHTPPHTGSSLCDVALGMLIILIFNGILAIGVYFEKYEDHEEGCELDEYHIGQCKVSGS
jgi:hypothetical protein